MNVEMKQEKIFCNVIYKSNFEYFFEKYKERENRLSVWNFNFEYLLISVNKKSLVVD